MVRTKGTKKQISKKGGNKKMYSILIFLGLCMIYSYPIVSIFIIGIFIICHIVYDHNTQSTIIKGKKKKNIKFGVNKTYRSEFIDEDIYLGGFRR